MAALLDILYVQGSEGQIIKKTMFDTLPLIIITVLCKFTCSREQEPQKLRCPWPVAITPQPGPSSVEDSAGSCVLEWLTVF